jgi:hypothetical protein
MNMLTVSIVIFILLELVNVCILYFAPDSRRGNSVSVFNHWESLKVQHEAHLFVRYLINWVAGSKLIFIALFIVILLVGNEKTQLYAVAIMIVSIATYFWRLHPLIKMLDDKGFITPKGYSKTLGYMILGFILMFSVALTIHIATGFTITCLYKT